MKTAVRRSITLLASVMLLASTAAGASAIPQAATTAETNGCSYSPDQ